MTSNTYSVAVQFNLANFAEWSQLRAAGCIRRWIDDGIPRVCYCAPSGRCLWITLDAAETLIHHGANVYADILESESAQPAQAPAPDGVELPFVAHELTVRRGSETVCRAISKRMAVRIAAALNRYTRRKQR